ncbi:Kinesin-like protein [Quillaja saponaria]|uniref:Kinesin-like protein n=1 Tax=Quillaja saponaria TaxID=32244 RepID=A0AAD7Q8H6_QUISA|nr:Kinesin-like protein [Quillaja saponaria]
MEVCARTGSHDFNLASRKAEEAAWRRYQAAEWLESLLGPLNIPKQPSEREFISCLRNGLILCNAVNKINPGAVSRVVDNQLSSQSFIWESQPLPAYQYFENVRNFLVAANKLKLPAFEASDLERDTLEAGSAAKVVDCILALKSYQEWKLTSESRSDKHVKSPLAMHSSNRMHSKASTAFSSESCRRLDMTAMCEKQPSLEHDTQKVEVELVESIVKILADCLVDSKENIDGKLFASCHNGHVDLIKLFSGIMSSCLEEQLQEKFPEKQLQLVLKDFLRERSSLPVHSTSIPSEDSKCQRETIIKGFCNRWQLLHMQEKELLDLKALLLRTKKDFDELQSQLQRDLNELGSQVHKLSTAAFGYHKVVKENMNLHNMVQDLKGNIRVYCRIRPSFNAESKNAIDFIGNDGSLVIIDPSKTQKDGKKVFQFNRVFSPTATQDEVFKDTQPLIRSVMDGYNVCIFAYGQTGSGKTHTMSGPSGRSTKDLGINYLALNDLFQMCNRRKDIIDYEIYVQMVEIYNEQIRSCSENGFTLPDATLRSVKSTTHVLNLMKLGEVNRVVSSTASNNQSSRSHSVLTVHVHGKDMSGSTIRSCLHLVDLAGSERVDKSEVTGERLKEAQYINKSLSCLGDVITALAQKNSHIPYRNSKLTLLLQDSLGGHAKTLMFAHISPEEESFCETFSTLKFAQRVSTVELGAARLNRESSEVIQLKEQIEILKMALANKEAQSVSLNITKDQQTPSEKPRKLPQKTPPRPRRLSVENCSIKKTDRLANKEAQSVSLKRTKEQQSPSEKPRALPQKTPPRTRRLSIENCSTLKTDRLANKEAQSVSLNRTKEQRSPSEKPRALPQKTPPRPRRLSIENCSTLKTDRFSNKEAQSVSLNRTKEPQTPTEKARALSQRTPSRPRRLSIENCSSLKTDRLTHTDYRKGLKMTDIPTRLRRLSLEGPKYIKKDSLQPNASDNVSRAPQLESTSMQKYHLQQDAEAVSKLFGDASNGNSKYQAEAPPSPTSITYERQLLKTDGRNQVHPIQLPQTPEPLVLAKNEVQLVIQSEVTFSTDSQTPNMISSTNGKQIRRSLRTIGKLISGSEKRNQQNLVEARPPIKDASHLSDIKSPLTTNARAYQRRRSLTGIQPDRSRRSSLEGKPMDSS